MPRRCTICDHAERADIDRALVRGTAYRSIAKQYRLSESATFRHKAEHLPGKLMQAKDAEEVADADTLLDEVRSLHERTLSLLSGAEEAGELATALRAIREARANLELLAKLAGELNDNPALNVVVSPQWIQIRATILHALDPHPEARLAVADALSVHAGD